MWGKEKGTNKQPWTGVKQHPTFTIWPSWMKPQEAQRYKEADREPRKSLGGGGCKKEPREDWIHVGDGEDEERTGAADEENSRSNNRWAGRNMRMVGKKRAISMKEQRSRRKIGRNLKLNQLYSVLKTSVLSCCQIPTKPSLCLLAAVAGPCRIQPTNALITAASSRQLWCAAKLFELASKSIVLYSENVVSAFKCFVYLLWMLWWKHQRNNSEYVKPGTQKSMPARILVPQHGQHQDMDVVD